MRNSSLLTLATTSLFALALAGCGGGGGGGGTPTPPPGGGGGSGSGGGGSTELNYTPGQFPNEDLYKDRCQTPRAGTNDRQATTAHENFWLRSWSNRTYLWYNEITDRDPNAFNDRLAYFDLLKTTATTPSGNPKDQFHFTIPTDEYEQQVNAGASGGYGARFRIIRSTIPRDVRIAYVQSGTPAAAAGLQRGDKITSVNGVSVVSGNTQADVDVINAGLFPGGAGETFDFGYERDGVAGETTVTMTSEIVTSDPVLLTQTVDTTDDSGAPVKVGYIVFNTFGTRPAEQALFDAFTQFEADGVNELILDLRYNGGGFLDISSELGFMIAGDVATNGRTYETIVFNDKHPTINPVTGQTLTPSPFYSTARGFSVAQGTPLPSLDLDRVYVLSTSSTCSASESLINGLRGIDLPVFLIGTQTCGKPYGFYATDNCGETYFTIQFRGENDKGFGDYADGFAPTGSSQGEIIQGCTVADDLGAQLGSAAENVYAAALTHIETGACPTTTSQRDIAEKIEPGDPATSLLNDPRLQKRIFIEQAKIPGGPDGR